MSAQPPFVLTLDIGSSSIRAMLFDARARALPGASAQIPHEFRATPDGGVEADADALFNICSRAMDGTLADFANPVAAVASACFAMSVLGVDERGNAVTPVYTYADARGARESAELRARFDERVTHQRVGTLFHTSYLPARLLWLARERAAEFSRVRYWMSFGEYLYFKLLGARAVSHSIASWTGLLNRAMLEWDEELMTGLAISLDQLSPITEYGSRNTYCVLRKKYTERWHTLKDAAWFLTIGDGAAANVGSGCSDASRIAVTIGTSSAMRVAREQGSRGARGNFTPAPPLPRTSAFQEQIKIPDGLWSYRIDRDIELIGGALNEGGNLIAWLARLFQIEDLHALEKEIAAMQPDAHGLTMLPFLTGERAPNWNADARAAIIGLAHSTHPVEIIRAGMEAVAYRLGIVYDLLRGVAPDAPEIIASGGALQNSPAWAQIVADVLGAPVIASAEPAATSRGAAVLALKALGVIQSFAELPAAQGARFEPEAERHRVYARARKRQGELYGKIITTE
ncbi:MAG: gluconokinase [Chloroflexi bacterium]|nr:gluconokinase [Chloroflexota bacterium]